MANSADSDQKPTDLDLHCLQRLGISGFSRTRVKKLWSAQEFGLEFFSRGISRKSRVRVVHLAYNTPTDICPYQILSNYMYLKPYVSYGLQKICTSGEISTSTKKVRVVSLAHNMPTDPPLHPYQIQKQST